MIKPITDYMRKNAAYCIQGPVQKVLGDAFQIKEKYFLNKNHEKIADLVSIEVQNRNKKVTKNILQTANGLYKITEHHIDLVKLQKSKKKTLKFPYMMTSSVIYDLEEPVRRTMFMIKQGVQFLTTDKDGLLLYKKLPNFQVKKLQIHTDATTDDCIFDISKALRN